MRKKRLFIELGKNKLYVHLIPMVLCSLHTGMRRGEILSLRWENIDFYTKHIEPLETKSGKARKIPISNKLLNEFLKLKEDRCSNSEYVFVNPQTGTKYLRPEKSFNKAVQNAEIRNFRFHDLRHTAATRMTEVGIDLAVVQEILGHSDIKTTMRYAHPVPERKLKAIEALNDYI